MGIQCEMKMWIELDVRARLQGGIPHSVHLRKAHKQILEQGLVHFRKKVLPLLEDDSFRNKIPAMGRDEIGEKHAQIGIDFASRKARSDFRGRIHEAVKIASKKCQTQIRVYQVTTAIFYAWLENKLPLQLAA